MHFSNWQNKFSAVWLLLLCVVAIALASAWLKDEIKIQTNIFALLPELQQDPSLQQTQDYVNQQLNNQVFVVIDAKDQATLEHATRLLADRMLADQVQGSALWKPLKAAVDSDQFAQTLYRHQAGLLHPDDLQILKQQDYAALTEKSLMQMITPGVPITAELLQRDPLLLFPRFAMELAAQQSDAKIELQNGFATIVDDQGFSRLLTLELTQSPYNIDYQDQTQAWIQKVNLQLQGLGVQAHWTGTIMFSAAGTHSAQKEISTIGVGSSIGILLLVWFGFRSFRPMLTEFIAVSTGSLVAFAVTHWMFAEIHMMTLVFGASLIGVCVDFSFYFMALQSQHRSIDGFKVLKPVLPSLFMGLMTTLVAYVFLSFTPFPGFQQIAVFSMVGLASAWISSILLLPRLKALNAAPAIQTLSGIGRIRNYVQQRVSLRYSLIAGVLVLAGSSLLMLKANDDVRNLQSMDQHLKQQDQYVRERFGQQQGRDYFVVQGKTPAEMAQAEQQLIQKLSQLQAQAQIDGFQAIGRSIPTLAQQQANIQLLQAIPKSVLSAYAQDLQLDLNQVLAWQQQLGQQPLLSLSQFSQHPLGFLQVNPSQRLVLIQGIHALPALKALESSQVSLVQPVAALSQLFADHRIQAQYLIFFAWMTLILALGLIYGLKSILPLVLPVSLALMSTFAVQAWLGVEINLFSIMAVFLIMGIGVDYAIFYRHGHDHAQVVGMALFLCMMSTLLGFGLLALSQTYAIFSFGITVLFGVIFSFVYATLLTSADTKYALHLNDQSKS
ncbi:putative exporter [Acinetobacter calcoaceticus]|uniref:Putative exporter n=1 Tax=Acinetobacter calcoaceticus TaxID=471 RepID=A0A4R1XU55_ACICA|nr:putative exporter [Acinetobacter calcoaceticus]